MTRLTLTTRRPLASLAMLFMALWIAGCASKPPQTTATLGSIELPFAQAITEVTDALLAQAPRLPDLVLSKVPVRRGVMVDPMLDATSGQQTAATREFEQRVTNRIGTRAGQLEILPFRTANIGKAQYLLTGTTTRTQPEQANSPLRLDLALTEFKTGKIVAQASSLARGEGVDNTPTAYYRDSPIFVKDQVIEGYIKTSAGKPGSAANLYYFERVDTATTINDAGTLYDAERYQEALGQYRRALASTGGEQLRVFNGIYLASMKLGNLADAEKAFGRIVAMGIGANQLGVKFLFNPGGTTFWSDPKVSGAYDMWLRQIAQESTWAKVCMDIVGHTSHTGPAAFNDALSLKRAALIRQRLMAEARDLDIRTKADGKGFRENIVGSATDDIVDALDRRVEFRIVPCAL